MDASDYHNDCALSSGLGYPEQARRLHDIGYSSIPIAPGKKYPTLKGWSTVSLPVDWPSTQHGVGIRTGDGLVGFDIDIYHADIVEPLVALIGFFCMPPQILTRVGQPPKVLIPFASTDFDAKEFSNKWIDSNGVINQIEILGKGQQFVAYGIHPDTGKPYDWSGELPPVSELPVLTREIKDTVFAYFDELAAGAGMVSEQDITLSVAKKREGHRTCDQEAPGSVYNRSVPIEDVLLHFGWTHCKGDYWTRPGKSTGISASVHNSQILWCFTSSTCLPQGTAIDAFELITQYEFGGDKSACAKALRQAMQEVA